MPVGTEHEEVGFGFNRRRDHRAAPRALRLRRRRLLRLGTAHRHAARRRGLARPCLGCRAPEHARSGRPRSSTRASTSSAASPAPRSSSSSCAPAGSTRRVIDASVRRLLRDKFRLGLFDDPVRRPATGPREVVGARAHVERGHARADALDRAARRTPASFSRSRGAPRVYLAGPRRRRASRTGAVVERAGGRRRRARPHPGPVRATRRQLPRGALPRRTPRRSRRPRSPGCSS